MKLNKVLVSAAALSGIAAAGSAANADTVSVKSGDTVSELAQKFNTTVEAIQKANNLKDVNFITVGQQLNIPTNDNAEQQVQQSQTNTAAQVQQSQNAQQAAIAQQQAAQRQAQLAAQQQAAQAALQAQQAAQKQAEEQAAAKKAQEEAAAQAAAQKQAQQQAAAQAQTAAQQSTQKAASNNQQSSSNSNNSDSSESAAKAWIVAHESGGNYNARNGQYVGAYQLSSSYLNGDYSQANQDRVANQYVASRYGNWVNAQKHWQQCGWY